MEDAFLIEFEHDNKTYSFEAAIVWMGFQHRIQVLIDGTLVHFEPDEERNYRAILHQDQGDISKLVTPDLLETIAHYLEASLKE
jgi:hypothetical protein